MCILKKKLIGVGAAAAIGMTTSGVLMAELAYGQAAAISLIKSTR